VNEPNVTVATAQYPVGGRTKVGRALSPRTILIGGMLFVVVELVAIMLSMGSYDSLVAVILGPSLFLISLPILSRQATRERDGRVFWLLVMGLIVKLLGAIAQIYVVLTAYSGVADATDYYQQGLKLASQFRAGNFATGLHPIVGTNFIKIVSGVVLALIGPSRIGGFLVFSWLAFWGLFFFYRAYMIAVPSGKPHSYAKLIFFLPSLIFWPSAMGKDAWMLLGLGIAALGLAWVLQGRLWRGLAIAAPGLAMDVMVRPHIVALVGLGLVAAYLFRRPRAELRQLAPIAKVLTAVVTLALAFFLVGKSNSFLKESGVTNPGNLNSSLFTVASRTTIGNSSFQPTVATTFRRVPVAFLTVLFRPLIVDARSFQGAIAGAEGTFLLLLALLRWRWLVAAVKSVRRQPSSSPSSIPGSS